jgi:hypothetical protein
VTAIANRSCFTSIINEIFIRPASLRISDNVTHYGTEEKTTASDLLHSSRIGAPYSSRPINNLRTQNLKSQAPMFNTAVITQCRGAQIWTPHRRCHKFVGPQYENCFISRFWRLRICGAA